MKFTIGIPAFKASFFKECLESIVNQNFRDFEVIIVDDASPENIAEIAKPYLNDQIRYQRNEKNFGALHVVDNWNACLSLAKGDYFVLMGDDDRMDINYLEEFDQLINQYPDCKVYHCRSVIIDQDSNPITLTEPRPEFETVYDSILERLKGNRLAFISDYVFHTQTLKNNGGFFKLPLAWASDDISVYIAAATSGIAHTNKPVFQYRRSAITISNSGQAEYKMVAIMAEEVWLQSFLKKQPTSTQDQILWGNINTMLYPYIQKKKVYTMSVGHSKGPFALLNQWLGKRNLYRYSFKDLAHSALLSIKG